MRTAIAGLTLLGSLIGAASAAPATRRRPLPGSLTIALPALAGAAAISLFYINTYYLLAPLVWLVGALLLAPESRALSHL